MAPALPSLSRESRPAQTCTREAGVAMVELALCAPLLAVLVFGVVDLGRA